MTPGKKTNKQWFPSRTMVPSNFWSLHPTTKPQPYINRSPWPRTTIVHTCKPAHDTIKINNGKYRDPLLWATPIWKGLARCQSRATKKSQHGVVLRHTHTHTRTHGIAHQQVGELPLVDAISGLIFHVDTAKQVPVELFRQNEETSDEQTNQQTIQTSIMRPSPPWVRRVLRLLAWHARQSGSHQCDVHRRGPINHFVIWIGDSVAGGTRRSDPKPTNPNTRWIS